MTNAEMLRLLLDDVRELKSEIRSLTAAVGTLRASYVEQGKVVASLEQRLRSHLQTGEHFTVTGCAVA